MNSVHRLCAGLALLVATAGLSGSASAEIKPPPEMRAMNSLLFQCYGREANAVAHDAGLQDQVEALTKQVADLTKERDALKAPEVK